MCMRNSRRMSLPFDRVPFDETLALLHVNHQISAEAVSTFYGKRKFCSSPDRLIPFLEGIASHRHLIKDIEVLEDPVSELWFPPQIFDLLQTLDALRSFTMRIEPCCLPDWQEHLIEAGIHKIVERMVVTVHTHHQKTLFYEEEGLSEYTGERVEFINTWTCAKGGGNWKDQGFRCLVLQRNDEGRVEWSPDDVPQPCNHDRHLTGIEIPKNRVAWST